MYCPVRLGTRLLIGERGVSAVVIAGVQPVREGVASFLLAAVASGRAPTPGCERDERSSPEWRNRNGTRRRRRIVSRSFLNSPQAVRSKASNGRSNDTSSQGVRRRRVYGASCWSIRRTASGCIRRTVSGANAPRAWAGCPRPRQHDRPAADPAPAHRLDGIADPHTAFAYPPDYELTMDTVIAYRRSVAQLRINFNKLADLHAERQR